MSTKNKMPRDKIELSMAKTMYNSNNPLLKKRALMDYNKEELEYLTQEKYNKILLEEGADVTLKVIKDNRVTSYLLLLLKLATIGYILDRKEYKIGEPCYTLYYDKATNQMTGINTYYSPKAAAFSTAESALEAYNLLSDDEKLLLKSLYVQLHNNHTTDIGSNNKGSHKI